MLLTGDQIKAINYFKNLEHAAAIYCEQTGIDDRKNMTDDEFIDETFENYLQRKQFAEFVKKCAPTLTTWADIPDGCTAFRFEEFSALFEHGDEKMIKKIYCSIVLRELVCERLKTLRRRKELDDERKKSGLWWDRWLGFIRYIPYEWFSAISHTPTPPYRIDFLDWLKHEGTYAPEHDVASK